jgi:glutathione peroxidase
METGLAQDRTAKRSLCAEGAAFEKKRLASEQVDDICRSHLGKVMLIVNTASKCGFTYQYEGLETLYDRYRDQGLVVLGFPSNDFGGQEPGSEMQIQNFCVNTYAIKFPMYEKTRVIGSDKDPLYQALVNASGSEPRWNFHKYLVDRNGVVVSSHSSSTKPLSKKLVNEIESLLSTGNQSLSAISNEPKIVKF